jgi:hypothetical protein
MAEVFISKVSEFPDGERRIVQNGGHNIGLFHWQGQGGNAIKLFNLRINGQKLAKVA